VSASIHCDAHGESTVTFVCVHIAEALNHDRACGFYYSSLEADDEPSAWCEACDSIFAANGGKWTDEANNQPELRLLCHACFMRAAELNGVGPQ